MDTRKQVSLRIQQLCAAHGYNINSLARKAGIPPTTLKNIVYGSSHNPGIVTIKLICDGLEISLYDFFDADSFKQAEMEDIG
ncbi:MAG: helix-turn-helix transcriptional regulator [Dysosmobacter sp.]|uniref:helix-turn-helix domain-containing protein n=1 Tax=uncultured Oscillibacter sp. TaxID=876091 RepID=UPI0026078E1E|nr:helix-turn-helix transcriptional regulator [uncultured Oscillibacter sp.]MCX4371029.1 helix-turn-helix transcriptional regulator [Dysosmobacter sp.]